MASTREDLASLSSAIKALQDPSSSDLAALNNELTNLMAAITDALAAFDSAKGAAKVVVERIYTSGVKLSSIAVSLDSAINALPTVPTDVPPEVAPVEPPVAEEPPPAEPPPPEPAPEPVPEPAAVEEPAHAEDRRTGRL